MSLVLPDWPDAAERGADLFNRGAFFEAHEAWEEVWRRTEGHVRRFYQGLIQLAVGLRKVQENNYAGGERLLGSGLEKLAGITPVGAPFEVDRLVRETSRLLEDVRRLGPEHLTYSALQQPFPRLRFRGRQGAPGLKVGRWPVEAQDGVRHFDVGAYGEASAAFEAAQAAAPGEEALLYKALGAAAAAFQKQRERKERPARVLAASALKLLGWLSPIELPPGASIRLDALVTSLGRIHERTDGPEPLPTPKLRSH